MATQGPASRQYGLAQHMIASNPADTARVAQSEAVAGEALMRQGNYLEAAARFAQAARLRPNEGTFHIYLAYTTWRGGLPDQAGPQFRTALALQPNNPALHEILAWYFVEQGQLDVALTHASSATSLQPGNASFQITHADVLCALGRPDDAWKSIEPLLGARTGGMWLARVYCKIAPRIGHERQAVELIENELKNPGVSAIDRERLHYAAANLLDALGEYDAAFEHARLANEHNHRQFDPVRHSRFVSNRIAYYTREQLDSLPRARHGSMRPVFIVGVTRSGTSLVEQILASHPQVFGGGELSYLSECAAQAGNAEWSHGEQFPQSWNHVSVSAANQLAAHYLDRINKLNSTATYVTDKMPENFLFLGTAELLLPQCKVIHCVRDPRDTCLSCYFTDFASGKEFSVKQSYLVQYYRDYQRLMEHWKKVLKIPILDVKYEDVVADQQGQTRRILEYLNLPWDENCLQYHKNKRHVATASRDQVRKPIYNSSVGRWRHYEKYIPELMTLVKE